jgi:AbiV family abortive infection protein
MPDEFEQSARKHSPKLLEALLADIELAPFWGDFEATFENGLEGTVQHLADAVTAAHEAVQKLNLTKQAGFYVDRQDGIVHSPAETTGDGLTIDLARVARVVEMLLIRDHSRTKFDMPTESYDSTEDLQVRLLAITPD